ncbi:MAG TPA: neutral/alkaline non-lysosomal ceramidase N-terminal domain-containing protein [Archangium sp.]|uniref:neutral/alkaline ceramidase n=1 Tax=Archangium sp. TaxID=1872627 RepID=UPI002E35C67D|nr:neutral/alkaline non-lysosomal ceramidase N-terminal domain-containing protein [Archangium sp.]HEX5748172.1 neutral/alkaline non-lysosomal ceramidase N-terminal domain-containing protein [Archangium sp.]
MQRRLFTSPRLLAAVVLALALGACDTQSPDEDSLSTRSAALADPCSANQSFQIGAGIHDITGPAAEIGMMGYAMVDQKTAGIHQRLRSRAFVIASPCNGKRAVFVSADLGQVFQGVRQQVVEKLRARYGTLYTDDNVLLSATHTHSGPGGHSHYALYNLTILGYDKQGFDAIVDGIFQSIVRAHDNLAPGTIRVASGDLLDASINRSPEAYLRNPATERAQYSYDTDKRMTLLRLRGDDGSEVGLINWFAVHATSMGNDNLLISGDNKGYASYLFEKLKGTSYTAQRTFVAAFAQSNEGDVTPNIYGGTNGGGANDFESTELSARKQYNLAKTLYDTASAPLTGGVDFRHAYVAMDSVQVAPAYTDGVWRTTCEAAIGDSMLAGAEDGPGYGYEGSTCESLDDAWSVFNCALSATPCQGEKPIVLEMGTLTPYPWTPEVLPLQVVRLGNVALVGLPFEPTTMAGRRVRQQVLAQLSSVGVDQVLIAGLSNAYAGYLATREEYAKQDYEGASTHFGPWTLAAVQQEVDKLAVALRTGATVATGPTPRDLRNNQSTVQTGVVYDDKPLLVSFGSVVTNALASYTRGQTVSVKFWGGHPKNNLRRQGSFLQVQRKSGTSWVTVANDWDWETKYRWQRYDCAPTFGCSHVTTEWTIPADTVPGTYRIRHDGDWKSGWDGLIRAYSGTSREFTVN